MVQLFWNAFHPKKMYEIGLIVSLSVSSQNINLKKYDKNPERSDRLTLQYYRIYESRIYDFYFL